MSEFFSGDVSVYDEVFFIDANTGVGFERLIRKIDPLLFKMSKAFYINGFSQEDLKQELAIMAIEGVRVFDGTRGVKLSTFIQTHLHNKIISKIRSTNKLSNNAYSANENGALPAVCECGSDVFLVLSKYGEEVSKECTICDRVYKRDMRIAKREIGFCEVTKSDNDVSGSTPMEFIDTVDSSDAMYSALETAEKAVELEASIQAICESKGMDQNTAKLLRLISIDDYSVKEAAEEVGMSSWTAALKLKDLARNRKIRDMLGR